MQSNWPPQFPLNATYKGIPVIVFHLSVGNSCLEPDFIYIEYKYNNEYEMKTETDCRTLEITWMEFCKYFHIEM